MALLQIENLKTYYPTSMGVVKAVDDVSVKVDKGETLGLVGESGCGKSTLGFSILRLIPPPGKIVGGKIIFNGENLLEKSDEEMRMIRGKQIAMVFQDPMTSLNPLMKIGEHIVETIMTHESVSEDDALERAGKLLDRLGIRRERLFDYPHQFSGGMRQRIMIGLALILNPYLLIADEPTTSLDVIVEAQILELLKQLKRDYNLTLILITHNMGVVAELADTVAVMYAGKIVEFADTLSLYEEPLHPYTQFLLKSIPNVYLSDQRLEWIPGFPPDLVNPPKGCRFHPRCPYVKEECRVKPPSLIQVKPNRFVACLIYGNAAGGE
jgi:oligopeptide/dipeptide ABC transporter ATP-binding protein